jgi:hypothetical protein
MLENIQEIEESGIMYYVIPENYSLFKATKTYDPMSGGLYLNPKKFYFFGVKNETPEYIKSYEEEYGIIFEFTTTRPYKLLALDKKETQTKLYDDAPRKIQLILEKNYGYTNGLRDSESNNDRELSEYICRTGRYDGYAIKHMSTYLGGSFHPEFMFCDISGINYVKKITSDVRVNEILAEKKEKEVAEQLKEQRKNKRNNQNYNYDADEVNDYDNNQEKRFKPKALSFMDDDDDEMETGGSKRRRYKRQKKTIKKRRNTIKKRGKKSVRKTIRKNKKSKHK